MCKLHKKSLEHQGEIFGTLQVSKCYHTRTKSGRSKIRAKVQCIACGLESDKSMDSLRLLESVCNCQKSSSKFITTKTRPKRYGTFKHYYRNIYNYNKKRNYMFDITIADLEDSFSGKCVLTGIHISLEDGTASIDRIDNSIGYIKNNIQWVHRTINYMKNELPQDEFIRFCHLVSCYNHN